MITQAYYDFFDALKENMNRDWFKARKAEFETAVKEPFEQLVEEVISRMREIDPEIRIGYKEAAFRIYRDTRFSKDKSPYKLWMGAVVSRIGRKNRQFPEIYFQFGSEENFIGAGLYCPSKEMLSEIRSYIAANPDEIEAINNDPLMRRYFPKGLQGERNKRLPGKEWMQIARQQPLILNKQFYTYKTLERKDVIDNPDLAVQILAHYLAMDKFNSLIFKIINNNTNG